MLQKQVVPVQFSGGLDTKSAKQLAIPGSFLVLENCVRRKTGRIEKRFGFDNLGNGVVGGGTITEGIRLASLDDDLTLVNTNNLYSYSTANDAWIDKGNIASVLVESQSVIRTPRTESMGDLAYADGVTVSIWEDDTGAVAGSVFDEATGSILSYSNTFNSSATRPKVVAANHTFYFLYLVGTTIHLTRLDANNPTSFYTEQVLVSDALANHPFDVCVSGLNPIITYATGGGQIRVAYITPSGFIGNGINGLPTSNLIGIAGDFTDLLAINVVTTSSNIYVTYSASSGTYANTVRMTAWDLALIGSSSVTVDTTTNVRNIGAIPTSGDLTEVYYEISASSVKNHLVKHATVTGGSTGISVAVAAAILVRSVGLYSKPIYTGGESYAIISHDSALQSTYFVVRSDGFIVAKMLPGIGGGHTRAAVGNALRSGLGQFTPIGSDYGAVSQITNKLQADLDGTIVATNKGIERFSITFGAASFFSDQLGDNLHFAGGILQNYDGVSVTEHGFHLFPEDETATLTGGPEITQVSISHLGSFYDVAGAAKAVQLYTPTGDHYFYFVVTDGTNTQDDPVLSGVGHPVNITSSDGIAQVQQAFMNAATSTSAFAIVGSSLTVIENVTAGVVTAGSATGSAATVTRITAGTAGGGSTSYGTYRTQVIYEWTDAQGQIHRSAPSILLATPTFATQSIVMTIPTLRLTQKTGTRANCKITVYRSQVDQFAVLYRDISVTNDPTVDTVTVTLTQSDAALSTQEVLYTVGGVLENIAPPASKIVVKHKNRLFLLGLEDGNHIAYSREFVPTEGVAFSDGLTLQTDPLGGKITGGAVLDDKLIIFKADRAYGLTGDGPLDTGAQNDYTNPQLISGNVGCAVQESIAILPDGLIFKSEKGIYLLSRSLSFQYIGAPVESFNDLTITSAVTLTEHNEVRFTTLEGTTLVYNYFFNQWSTFTNYAAVSGINALGAYTHLRSDGLVRQESTTSYLDAGARIRMAIETSWLAFAQLQGYQRIRRYAFLGDYLSSHTTQVKVAYDYEDAFTETVYFNVDQGLNISYYGDDATYGDSSVYGGDSSTVYQFSSVPRRQKCESIKYRIEDIDTITPAGGGSFNLVGLTLEVGIKATINKMRGSKRIGSL